MKLIKQAVSRLTAMLMLFFMSTVAFAQEKSADIDVTVDKGGGGANWYASPWVWIVGAAIFILLLVALLRGNSSRD
jgi:hypothetical protein